MSDNFNLFLESVDEKNRDFVSELNDFLIQNHYKYEIKSAKSGYVVSYILCNSKKTLATFVFRKSGIKLRIYADHVAKYQEFLKGLPEKMKKDIQKASICKRLVNPEDCNPKCAMGYSFFMDGETYQKCRHMAFMPALSKENNPFIREFLEKELAALNDYEQLKKVNTSRSKTQSQYIRKNLIGNVRVYYKFFQKHTEEF